MTYVRELRAEYQKIHHRVLEIGMSDHPAHIDELRNLQRREEQIVSSLRKLGVNPYEAA